MKKNSTTILSGNTYACRDAIRSIPGAKWDAARTVWVIEAGNMRERSIQSAAIQRLRSQGVTVTA